MYTRYSASVTIVFSCLLFTPLGPDHVWQGSDQLCTCVSALGEHRYMSPHDTQWNGIESAVDSSIKRRPQSEFVEELSFSCASVRPHYPISHLLSR